MFYCAVLCSCKNGGRRQGNMGHLMRIFNLVYKHCQETADVLSILQDCKFWYHIAQNFGGWQISTKILLAERLWQIGTVKA